MICCVLLDKIRWCMHNIMHCMPTCRCSQCSIRHWWWVPIVAPMVGGAAAAFIYWFFIDAHHIRDDSEEEEGPLSPTVKALIPESDISGEKMKDSKI